MGRGLPKPQWLLTVLESIGDAVIATDERGLVVFMNQPAESMTGWKEETARGQTPDAVVTILNQDTRQPVPNPVAKALREGAVTGLTGPTVLISKDGAERPVAGRGVPIRAVSGRICGAVLVFSDLTEGKQAEKAFERLSRQYQHLLESAGEGIYGVDLYGKTTLVNPAAARMIGYTREELIGRSMHAVLHHTRPDGTPYPEEECRIYDAFRHGIMQQVTDEVFWRKDGTSFHVEYTSTPIWEKETLVGAVVTFRDITERKRAEDQLARSHEQLRRLAAHLESVREEERTRIAREIHDELGQAMTGLKLDLAGIEKRLLEMTSEEPLVSLLVKIRSMSKILDATTQAVRRICTELRPGVLDEVGLVPAIEWQAFEFQWRTRIQCRLTISMRRITMDQGPATAIFRIFQELLTNVARHADATEVRIILGESLGNLVLEVSDNGRGITQQEIAAPQSLGLLGMCERALQWGGEVTISGRHGEGTTAGVRIPLGRAAGDPHGEDPHRR